ncbi:MAG: CSLREA domain-containing protein [Acidobacteria bacterium]|nr:CSLREA domain-containing protein [Acidobacteriota bacterium]
MRETKKIIFLLSVLLVFGALGAKAATITVNTTVDENNTGASCSLREAITAANNDAAFGGCPAGSGTDTISFGTTGTITVGSTLPTLNTNMSISGPGAASLTISGNNSVRIMTINNGLTVTISNLTMANGYANGTQAGAIDVNASTVTLSNCVFNNNRATFDGGAVRNNGGSMTVTNCTFSNNTADEPSGQGGALKQNGTSMTVTGSTFYNNKADAGGALHVGTGTTNTTVTNSTFANNSATFGGAIEARASATLKNCTLSGNVASAVGGINIIAQPFTLINTIVAGNLDPNGNQSDIEIGGTGSVNTGASVNNLIGTPGASGLTDGVNGNQVGVASPYLAPLGNYGGPTLTMPPSGASGALNAGTNTGVPATDQRGAARTAGGGNTDIGAVEVNFVVNLDTDGGDLTPGDGTCDSSAAAGTQCTLRAAVQEANAFAGTDVIAIDLPASSTILLGTALPDISTNMAILGSGAADLTVSGNGAVRNFLVSSGVSGTLFGMKIANGFDSTEAGCVFNQGTLRLSEVTVSNCVSNGQSGGVQNNGTLTIENSTISSNQAVTLDGGGVGTFGPLTVTGSTFNGNTANGQGGGIAVMNGGALQGSLVATNDTFSGNSADVTGGAISFDTSLGSTITNCTITENQQLNIGDSGGGLGISAGTVTLKNTIVINNTKSDGGQSDITGTVVAVSSFNLIGTGGAGGLTNDVNSNQVGVTDARLTPLGNYGGKTPTRALSGNSPAVNAGTATGAPATDQRGVARPQGAGVDIGAFEHLITITPTTIPAGTTGLAYPAQNYFASGGNGDFPSSYLIGTLPAGMNYNPATQQLAGTPTQAGSFPICVVITDSNGFSGAICHTLVINLQVVHHFAISSISSPKTAGTPFNITITAQDSGNNTVTGFTGTVNLTTTAGTISPTVSGAFTAGVATVSVAVTQSGTGKTISVNDGAGHTGTSNTFTVNVGALHHFAIGTITGTKTIGTPFSISLTAQDAGNNTVTSFNGTVNLSVSSGAISPTVSGAFTSGQRTQNVTLSGTGTSRTISVSDGAGHTAVSNSFAVTVPTAAAVAIGGRVFDAAGRALGKVPVTLTDSRGVSRTTVSSTFGYYRFDDVETENVYTITVRSKGYRFDPLVVNLTDELTDLNLVASPEGIALPPLKEPGPASKPR